jgi:hypothetical protein
LMSCALTGSASMDFASLESCASVDCASSCTTFLGGGPVDDVCAPCLETNCASAFSTCSNE